jgi:pimeloyl-ACP methyl ester carboxylesterase
LPIYETSAKYDGPALIIHGTGDRVVPYTYGERFHQIWPKSKLQIIDRADHGFSQQIEQVATSTAELLSQALLQSK